MLLDTTMSDNGQPSEVQDLGQRKDQGSKKASGGGKGGKKPQQQNASTKLRGMDKDSPEVRTSKTISWLLRHAAASQGLAIRQDGYVNVDELLVHPRLSQSALDLDGLRKIVAGDAKKRYDLVFEAVGGASSEEASQPELNGSWWIKANQGHSMKTVQLELKRIRSLDDVPSGVALHGTTVKAWEVIEKEGLSRMKRNHIHLAQGISLTNAISGLRSSAQILIFIDIPKALAAGVKFFLSDNGVVLTGGDDSGYLKPDFFLRVEDIKRSPIPGWEGSGPIESKAVATDPAEAATSSSKKPRSRPSRQKKTGGTEAVEESLKDLSVTDKTEAETQ